MKICSICNTSKELTEFSFKNKAVGRYASECKSCHQVMRNSYYKNNTAIEKERIKKVKQRYISWYKKVKATLKCELCEENHPATLQFHHLDSEEKEFNIATAIRGF